VTDDLDAILAEIRELSARPVMRPTDVTVDMLQDIYGGVAPGTAKERAGHDLVDTGLYETLKVYDPEARRERRVWRKL